MEVQFIKTTGNWRDVADAARTTIGMDAGKGEPSASWKRRMLLAEHSPIRKIHINWKWTNLLWWVQTHFTRHKYGVEWWVSTSRSDRTGVDRNIIGQDAPVSVEGEANIQAIINISRKRLCNQASKETRVAWKAFLCKLAQVEPEIDSVCVPECVYRNGFCPEYKSCGWNHTKEFEDQLKRYLNGMEKQINNKTNIFGKE